VTTGGRNGGWVQIDTNPLVLPTPPAPYRSNGVFADLSSISTIAYLNRNVTIPYMQQWNFGLGFEIGRNYGLEVTYVGSKGTELFGPPTRTNTIYGNNLAAYERDYIAGVNMSLQVPNPFGLTNAAGQVITVAQSALYRPNPMLGAIVAPLTQGSNSSYNSMQVQFVKRYSQGFQFNVNYTFSKSLDTSSCEGQFCSTNLGNWSNTNPQLYDGPRRLEKSNSTYDIPHNIHFSWVAEAPFGRGKRFLGGAHGVLNQIVGNWKLSGLGTSMSGKPWIAFLGTSAGLPDDTGSVRPNWAPGVTGCTAQAGWRQWLNVPSHQYDDYYNALALFTPPSRFNIGNVPRTMGMCRMPWTNTLDTALSKDFPIKEQVRVVFRAEAYSVLNHVNFIGNVNSNTVYKNLSYTTYVTPPVTFANNVNTSWSDLTQNIGPQRTMQLSLRIYF